jgi:hypothetical protein
MHIIFPACIQCIYSLPYNYFEVLSYDCYCHDHYVYKQVCAAAYALYGQTAASDVSAGAVMIARRQGLQLQSLEQVTASAVQTSLRGEALTDNATGIRHYAHCKQFEHV